MLVDTHDKTLHGSLLGPLAGKWADLPPFSTNRISLRYRSGYHSKCLSCLKIIAATKPTPGEQTIPNGCKHIQSTTLGTTQMHHTVVVAYCPRWFAISFAHQTTHFTCKIAFRKPRVWPTVPHYSTQLSIFSKHLRCYLLINQHILGAHQ